MGHEAILSAVLTAMLVWPGQERGQTSQPVGGLPAPSTVEALLQHPEVQSELKLTSPQIQKINQITRAMREKHDKEANPRALSQELVEALREVLKPGQAKRMEQIHLQRQGVRALADPKVEKALRLTQEQKDKLKTVAADEAKEVRMLFSPRGQNSFQQALAKVPQVRRAAVQKGVALLTDGQKKTWQELIGEPFQLKSEPPLIRQPPE